MTPTGHRPRGTGAGTGNRAAAWCTFEFEGSPQLLMVLDLPYQTSGPVAHCAQLPAAQQCTAGNGKRKAERGQDVLIYSATLAVRALCCALSAACCSAGGKFGVACPVNPRVNPDLEGLPTILVSGASNGPTEAYIAQYGPPTAARLHLRS